MTIFTKYLGLDIAIGMFGAVLAWVNWTDPQIVAAIIAAIPASINLAIRGYQALKNKRTKRSKQDENAAS